MRLVMRLAVIGHVDHGKSTLIGRLFHDAGILPEGRFEQLAAAAERRGVPFEFANLTDGLQAERDQNVTIDTTQILFRWQGREILFIDAPGHRAFIRNMVTGASQADAALLVIDAVDGIGEQTRRHALLLTLLGIGRLVVVVNKLDTLGAFPGDAGAPSGEAARRRFEQLCAETRRVLAPLGLAPNAIVPAAASLGWNVVNRAKELEWFDGPTVLAALFDLPVAPDAPGAPGAPGVFSVQDVYRRDSRRWLVGRHESGILEPGDPVVVLPSGQHATVGASEPVGALTLREPIFVSRGDVLASADAPVSATTSLHARVFWLGRAPFAPGRRYELRLGTQRADAELVSIARVIDASELVERADRSNVPAHDVADVELRLSRPVVVDVSGRVLSLSRFVLVDREPPPDIVGGGVVLRSTPVPARAPAASVASRVTAAERHARLGHRGAVIWLTGLSGAGKSTLADGLERALFERGLQVIVLDGDRVRFGLNADLGFSPPDRSENIRRIAEVAKLFAESGIIAITAFISPYAADRQRAREIVSGADAAGTGIRFVEVFVDAELAVCEQRDSKGLYRKARAGEIADFTGVSAPYEAPIAAEVVVKTAERSPQDGVSRLVEVVLRVARTPDA